jgi:hypothetical protein
MGKRIRLTERELTRLVQRVINEGVIVTYSFTTNTGDEGSFSWSPDGKTLTFTFNNDTSEYTFSKKL